MQNDDRCQATQKRKPRHTSHTDQQEMHVTLSCGLLLILQLAAFVGGLSKNTRQICRKAIEVFAGKHGSKIACAQLAVAEFAF